MIKYIRLLGLLFVYIFHVQPALAYQISLDIPSSWDVSRGYELSPNGTRVVYSVGGEIYSVSVNGGTSVKLNDTLAWASVREYHFTADSNYVVYRAPQDTVRIDELYRVPANGGQPFKLNIPGQRVKGFKISADGNYVVYHISARNEVGDIELYSVPITGGNAIKINGNGELQNNIKYSISPDSTRVIYMAKQEYYGNFELYSVSINGGAPVKLNDLLVTEGDILDFQISENSEYVIYRGGQVPELYSVPINGGSPVKLNGELVQGGIVWSFQISSDSTYVVYNAEQDIDNVYEVYSVPIGGGVPVKLHGDLLGAEPGLVGESAAGFKISMDNSRVVYMMAKRIGDGSTKRTGLYSVPINGGTPVRLSNDSQYLLKFQISPDSNYVVYRADRADQNSRTGWVSELYSVPISGGTTLKLNGTLVSDGGVTQYFRISADSTQVVYIADQDTAYVYELYNAPIRGGVVAKLNKRLPDGGHVQDDFTISSNSSHVVYRSDQDIDNQDELFAVVMQLTDHIVNPVAGSGGSITPNTPQNVEHGATINFIITPNNNCQIDLVIGCNGNLSGNIYNTGEITSDCTVTASFSCENSSHKPIVSIFGLLLNGNKKQNLQNVTYISQHDTDYGSSACLSTSVAMALGYHGVVANTSSRIIQLTNEIFPHSRCGQSVCGANLANYIESRGYVQDAHNDYRSSRVLDGLSNRNLGANRIYQKVRSEISMGRPIMIGSQFTAGPGHWVLVLGYIGNDYKKGKLIVHDPNGSWLGTTGNYDKSISGESLVYDFMNIINLRQNSWPSLFTINP